MSAIDAQVTTRSLLLHAQEYTVAIRLLANSEAPPVTVIGMLAAYTLELTLKAFLLSCGMSEADFIRRGGIGHDLERAWQACEDNGLGLTAARTWMGLLNIQHNRPFLYRYGRDGWGQSIPGDPRSLAEYIQQVLTEVNVAIDRS